MEGDDGQTSLLLRYVLQLENALFFQAHSVYFWKMDRERERKCSACLLCFSSLFFLFSVFFFPSVTKKREGEEDERGGSDKEMVTLDIIGF